jgi:coenzyme F420-dependent glucose-6-phosphate dehydrogenase
MAVFGWKAAPEQFGPVALLNQVVAAEEAGFESLDVSDHFHPWAEAGEAAFTWTWLGAAAARTSRITLGPGVTSPILRYHPAVLAQATATLAVMAPGRTYFAVGTGEALNDLAATGQWPAYEERQEMMAEAIDLIRLLWTGDKITWGGEYYETRGAKLYTRPQNEQIPIYVSSMVPNSATFAGEFGDGLFTVGGKEPDEYREMFEAFEEGARSVGKDPARLPRLIELNVNYTDDRDGVLATYKKYWAATMIPALFTESIYTPAQAEKNGAPVGNEAILKKMCLSANAREQVEWVSEYLRLGFTHIFFHSVQEEQEEFLRRYGAEVLPLLRDAAQKMG